MCEISGSLISNNSKGRLINIFLTTKNHQMKNKGGRMQQEIMQKLAGAEDPDEIKIYLLVKYSIPLNEGEDILNSIQKKYGKPILTFWEVGAGRKITIYYSKLIRFLS